MPEPFAVRKRARRRGIAVVVAAMLLATAGHPAAGQRGAGRADTARTGSIVGTVRGSDGAPVSGAQVRVEPSFSSVSDSNGAFALHGLPVGLVVVTVRRLGYAPLATQWEVGPVTIRVDLRIHAFPTQLPTVRVESNAEPYDARLAGFYRRMQQKRGYYLTRQDIERGHSFVMTDALQRLPGVTVYQMRGALGTTVRLAGASCPPLVFVDGFPAALGHFDLNMIDLQTVEGVEVYPRGTSVPSVFMGPYGMGNCGVIAIWSRPMRPNVRADQLPPVQGHVNVDSLLQAKAVYTPATVDEPAAYLKGTGNPVYPDSLFRAHVTGKVVAQFVVDSSGAVEPQTVTIVSGTDSLFEAAVRAALPGARFTPGRVGNRPVRQLVEMPFEFKPTGADSTGGGPRSRFP